MECCEAEVILPEPVGANAGGSPTCETEGLVAMEYNGKSEHKRLMVAPGWAADDCSTVKECCAAIDSLNVAIAQIEEGLNGTRARAAAGVTSTSAG
jgi:hypothetical protein